jgi:hypothetical protein
MNAAIPAAIPAKTTSRADEDFDRVAKPPNMTSPPPTLPKKNSKSCGHCPDFLITD